MDKRGKFMVGGAFVSVIGIIGMFMSYNRYKSLEDALAASGTPPGIAETTVGILIAAAAAFVVIYGVGLLPEEGKALQ